MIKFLRQGLAFRVGFIVVSLFGLVLVGLLPGRTYGQEPGSNPVTDGFQNFSGAENHPDGYSFAWGLGNARLIYPSVPRYSKLNLRLKLSLGRPAGVPPARIEIYENSVAPAGTSRLITVLEAQPDQTAPQDYYITIPPRPEGAKGVQIEFKSNTFQVKGDRRELAFIFLESRISLPRTHFLSLFWPHPYWLAGLILLTLVTAWALRAGLGMLETGLLAGMLAFILIATTDSTYQQSGWLLAIVLALGGFYWWEGQRLKHNRPWSIWPLWGATALLVLFFLFSGDALVYDINYYIHWSATIHEHGLWNVYKYDELLNYAPLILYILWVYNLIVYPLGLQNDPLAWRVTASLMYLTVIGLLYLICREMVKKTENGEAENDEAERPVRLEWLVILAFNASFFFNPVLWGQSDMMALLALVGSFYLLYRRQPIAGGIALGLTAISKPEVWFVLPLLVWWLVQRCGWKRALIGLVAGGALALGLSAITFGLDSASIQRYLSDPQLVGENNNDIPLAFNLNYLILGSERQAIPAWLSLFGFGLVGLVLLGVIYSSRGRNRSLYEYGLAAAVQGLSCFSWLIKMKDRYLIYGMPFFGLAALQDRRLLKPFLLLSWLQLIQLVISLYGGTRGRLRDMPDNFYLWSFLLDQEWLRRGLSACTLLLFVYLAWVYLRGAVKRSPRQREAKEIS